MCFIRQENQLWCYVFPNQKQKAEHDGFLSLSPLSLIISNDSLFYQFQSLTENAILKCKVDFRWIHRCLISPSIGVTIYFYLEHNVYNKFWCPEGNNRSPLYFLMHLCKSLESFIIVISVNYFLTNSFLLLKLSNNNIPS